MRRRHQPKRFPHVHYRQPNPRTLLRPEPGVELSYARLRAVRAAKPDRTTSNEIADHNPVAMTFPDGDLINADCLWARRAGTLELGLHILLVERLDRMPVQLQFRRHLLDRRSSTTAADIVRKPFGIERIVRQKIELLALHLAASAAVEPPHLHFEINPRVATRQITHPAQLAIVPAHLDTTTASANRFFERRLSLMTRAFGSPKTPCTVGCGRKPGKQYASHSRRLRCLVLAIQNHGNFQARSKCKKSRKFTGFWHYPRKNAHSIPRRPKIFRIPVNQWSLSTS